MRNRCAVTFNQSDYQNVFKTTRQINNLSERQLITPFWSATAIPVWWTLWASERHVNRQAAIFAFLNHKAIPCLASRHLSIPFLRLWACNDLHLPRPGVKKNIYYISLFYSNKRARFCGPRVRRIWFHKIIKAAFLKIFDILGKSLHHQAVETSTWVIGISPKAKGCRSGCLLRIYILKNDP